MAKRRAVKTREEAGWGNVRWRVMRHLLKERPSFPSSRELARTLGMGHSKVAEVTNFLLFQRALRQTEAGFSVEWDQLARSWVLCDSPVAAPARTLDLVSAHEALHGTLRARGFRIF